MNLQFLSIDQVERRSLEDLGIHNFAEGLFEQVAIAQAYRRALAVGGPQTHRSLIDSVSESLMMLPGFKDSNSIIVDVLDALIARGDFLELWDANEESHGRRRLVYPSAHSFVVMPSKRMLLLGVPPDNQLTLPDALRERVTWCGLSCFIDMTAHLADELRRAGLQEVELSTWVSAPEQEGCDRVVQHLRGRFLNADFSGKVPGLRILKQTDHNLFYRGRWGPPETESGIFVGRRPQVYGADVWCAAELSGGAPMKLIDLPFRDSSFPGHDEAWRLQAALDAFQGEPQLARVEADRNGVGYLSVFSPLPSWGQRYLEIMGQWVERRSGALFSFAMSESDVKLAVEFLEDYLWMKEG